MGRSKGPAIWRWGFIFGGSAGALGIIAAVAAPALSNGAGLLLDAVFVLLVLALYFLAGLLVARQTGAVGAAALGGLVAGIFSAILREIAAIFVVLSRPFPELNTSGLDPSTYQSIFVIGVIVGAVLVLLLFAGLGAGLAALGGLAGRPRTTMLYPMMYPGMPAIAGTPGMPGYPGYPGYPAMPQGYAPPAPGYPMPQGFGPPQGYAPQGYPPAGWYPPAPGYPPPPPADQPGMPSEQSQNGSVDQPAPGAATAQPDSMPPTSPQPEQPIYPPPLPPQYPS